MHVDAGMQSSLPFHLLKSRLSTAIVLSFFSTKKKVIKLSIILSKASRAYIISQDGLPGFLLNHHNNIMSWLYELSKTVDELRYSISYSLEAYEVENLFDTVASHKIETEKEIALMYANPSVYVGFLKALNRTDQLNELCDGTVKCENFTWHVYMNLIPEINKLRAEKQLNKGKLTDFTKFYV